MSGGIGGGGIVSHGLTIMLSTLMMRRLICSIRMFSDNFVQLAIVAIVAIIAMIIIIFFMLLFVIILIIH